MVEVGDHRPKASTPNLADLVANRLGEEVHVGRVDVEVHERIEHVVDPAGAACAHERGRAIDELVELGRARAGEPFLFAEDA